MFFDMSAIIEYYLEGPEYPRVVAALAKSGTQFFVSPTVIFEATTVLAGKGRHPARLNFGDCFSYAGAKASGAALLYVGTDFSRTDLA